MISYWVVVQYEDAVDTLDARGFYYDVNDALAERDEVAKLAKDWDGAVSVFVMAGERSWV